MSYTSNHGTSSTPYSTPGVLLILLFNNMIDITLYRARIGVFSSKTRKKSKDKNMQRKFSAGSILDVNDIEYHNNQQLFILYLLYIIHLVVFCMLVLCDTPGPFRPSQSLPFSHPSLSTNYMANVKLWFSILFCFCFHELIYTTDILSLEKDMPKCCPMLFFISLSLTLFL